MALTIAQFTAFQLIAPTVVNADLGVRTGYHVSNGSRAGEGMCTIHNTSVFGETIGTESFEIAVISGSFVSGDSLTISPGSGSCVINTVTAATHAGIQVTGTMSDTDSTLNTNEALDATETEITVGTDATAVFEVGQILRISDTVDEYVLIDKVHSATEIWVIRGLYGTSGTHTTGKDIYLVDTDLLEQVLDADVTGGWGYSTTSNGRIELDCHLLFGKTDQSSVPIFISSSENVDISATATNYITNFGNSSYRTYLEFGIGYLGDITDELDGVAMKGSIITGGTNTLQTNPYTTTYIFDTSINLVTKFNGALVGKNYSVNGTAPQFAHRSGETSKAINTYINMASPSFVTDQLDTRNMIVYGGGYNLIYSVTDSDITGLTTDSRFFYGGFVTTGDKKFRDCKCVSYLNNVFIGYDTDYYSYKSFSCNVKDEKGNNIEGVTVKCNYRLTSTANVFNVVTDSDGDISPQQVQFMYIALTGSGFAFGTGTPVPTRDIEYFIYKSGYKPIRGRINIQDRDDPICVNAVLEAARFIEQRSIG